MGRQVEPHRTAICGDSHDIWRMAVAHSPPGRRRVRNPWPKAGILKG
jgi:hypothetical protein